MCLVFHLNNRFRRNTTCMPNEDIYYLTLLVRFLGNMNWGARGRGGGRGWYYLIMISCDIMNTARSQRVTWESLVMCSCDAMWHLVTSSSALWREITVSDNLTRLVPSPEADLHESTMCTHARAAPRICRWGGGQSIGRWGGGVNTLKTLKFEKGGGAWPPPAFMVAPPLHARPNDPRSREPYQELIFVKTIIIRRKTTMP